MMKPLIILWLLFGGGCVLASVVVTDELTLSVKVTTGEDSRDSSSHTTHITVGADNKIITWESESGGHRDLTAPERAGYKLSVADKSKLIEMLRSGELLKSRSIELERTPSNYQYFEISIESSIGSKSSSIRISGSRTAVEIEQQKLYQNSLELIKELYRIIDDQGGNVELPTLIAVKRTPPAVESEKFEKRCGWFDNPTPANYSLYDKDREWIIGVQGGYQVEDFDWPDFKKQWVATNNSYGYGCACFQMTVDAETSRALEIKSSYARPPSACRNDKALKKKWGFTLK